MTSLQFLQDQGFPTQYVSLLSLLQIVYMTATLPLILLIIFFFRGVHLKGYQEGLALLFIPEVSKSVEGLNVSFKNLRWPIYVINSVEPVSQSHPVCKSVSSPVNQSVTSVGN